LFFSEIKNFLLVAASIFGDMHNAISNQHRSFQQRTSVKITSDTYGSFKVQQHHAKKLGSV